jgi:GNAT superfamily N-acetyltransferase
MPLGSASLRLLEATDSLDELTALLHRAYAPLAAAGFRYTASYQDVETTRRRIAKGECYLLLQGPQIIGTITLVAPATPYGPCEWYERSDVAVLTQFAIDPEHQGRGLGGELMRFGEARAAELGAREVAVDTAEGARHLIEFYEKRGYREVGYAQWKQTNYRSMLLSKRLLEDGAGSVAWSLRDAAAADVPSMFDVRAAVNENRMTRAEFAAKGVTENGVRQSLATHLRGWVAEVDGRVVAYSLADGARGCVYAVFVLAEYQRRGVGTELLSRATEWLFECGFRSVFLDTDPATQAYEFYRRRGWVDVGSSSGDERRLERGGAQPP